MTLFNAFSLEAPRAFKSEFIVSKYLYIKEHLKACHLVTNAVHVYCYYVTMAKFITNNYVVSSNNCRKSQ